MPLTPRLGARRRSRPWGLLWPALLCALLVLIPWRAGGHQAGLSRGTYSIEPRASPDGALVILGELALARADVRALARELDRDHDGALAEVELLAAGPAIAARVVGGIALRVDGSACAGALERLDFDGDDGLRVLARYRCPAAGATLSPATLELDARGLLEATDVGHRHILDVARGPAIVARELALHRAAPRRRVSLAPAASTTPQGGDVSNETVDAGVAMYLGLGVEHILGGVDHLVFVLGLVLASFPRPASDKSFAASRHADARRGLWRFRSLIGAITAFTIGHSLSLALVALGRWAPDPAWVEPAIALSIVYVGVENCWVLARPGPGRDAAARRRWRVTLPFGFLHGLGFAGALLAIGLPAGRVELALVLFNLGVELGQLLALAPMLALVYALWRWSHGRRVALALSVLVALAGLAWFIARAVELG